MKTVVFAARRREGVVVAPVCMIIKKIAITNLYCKIKIIK
jgi:hypothetical protein